MAQLIEFPVRNTEQTGVQDVDKHAGGKQQYAPSAKVLFFTGVRYERVIVGPQPERLLSPAGRGGRA